jgi:hypothetical protein
MEREYPDQYSKPLIKVLKAVSFGTPSVVGSSADYRIMYAADYDLVEDVILRRGSSKKFQDKIRKIQKVAKIVDIKCGEISEWNLLKKPYVENGKLYKYKQADELKHLSALWQNKIITHDEYMTASELLKPHLDAVEFLEARKELRFGLLRWTVPEVLKGYKTLRDETIYYLDNAFRSKGITKLDLIAWITSKYVEISNIIVWTNSSGKPYAYIPAINKALKENILEFEADKNYVKVAKRMYSLAKQFKDQSIVDELTNILNSPIGKLYMVTADMEVLEEYPNAVTQKRKRKQLDTFKDYFAKLYFPDLNRATPSNTKLDYLKEILQAEMKKALEEAKLLPIPRDYRI